MLINCRLKTLITCALLLIISGRIGQSDAQKELELLSPIGALTRSLLIPGWGQIYTGKKLSGTATFISSVALVAGGSVARSSFSKVYNEEYKPAALADPNSEAAKFYFDKANQRYKTSRAFFISAVGFWAYGMVDSYVNANVYNARLKAEKLRQDLKKVNDLELQFSFFEARSSRFPDSELLLLNVWLEF